MTYPVAEIFTSPQGEGFWTGTLMTFVRLAGCTVGKPYTRDEQELYRTMHFNPLAKDEEIIPVLQSYQEKCTAWDGTEFPCDTNYKMSMKLTPEQILGNVVADHVCITGGEPLMHDLQALLVALARVRKRVHIETSGTIQFGYIRCIQPEAWVTVSPKKDYLPWSLLNANEIKVLVDQTFNEYEFFGQFHAYLNSDKLWIQPVNDEHTIRQDNVQKCLELQKRYPNLKLSIQMHKVIGVR